MKKAIGLAAIGVIGLSAAAFAGEAKDWNAKIDAMFTEADANADASLTEAEFVDYHAAKARTHFAEMAGADGALTADEVKTFYAAKEAEKKDGAQGE